MKLLIEVEGADYSLFNRHNGDRTFMMLPSLLDLKKIIFADKG